MKNMVLGQDSTFTFDSFVERYNADLANDYGNVVNRVLVLIQKYFSSKIPSPGDYNNTDLELISHVKEVPVKVEQLMNKLKIHEAIDTIFTLVRSVNKYLEEKEPWKTIKEHPNQKDVTATTLYVSLESIRISTCLLNSIIPNKSNQVLEAMGFKKNENLNLSFGSTKPNKEVKPIGALFPRIDN